MPLPSFAALGPNGRASVLMTLAMAAFSLNDMLVKYASQSIEGAQIMAVRGCMASFLLICVAVWKGSPPTFRLMREPTVVLRTIADILCTISYISALRYLPLANASAIYQALPLAITLGAVLFLGEKVGWRRWCAIGVGFVGVLVILAPGPEGFGEHSVWVLAAVMFAAARDLITRRMPLTITAPQIASVTSLAVTVTGFLLLPLSGWRPIEVHTFGILASGAVVLAIGYALIVSAVRIGDMSFVAPFRYTILLFSVLLGMIAFSEQPSMNETIGALIVVASGLYTIRRESRRAVIRKAA